MSVKQNAESQGGVVLQAAGDITLTTFDAAPMIQVIETLSKQLMVLTESANLKVEERLADLESRIVSAFEKSDLANPQAFADPDFQFALRKAQQACARSGDDALSDVLVDLLVHRSAQNDRTRLRLSLNDAIERSAALTEEEFAELSLAFLVRNITVNAGSIATFIQDFATHAAPLLDKISLDPTSYHYLAAHSCASIAMPKETLEELFREKYAGLFHRGVERSEYDQYEDQIIGSHPDLIIPCLHDPSRFQLAVLTRKDLLNMLSDTLPESQVIDLWNINMQGFGGRDFIISILNPHFPDAKKLFDVWDNSMISRLALTSVGIVIAHANLKRLSQFDLDLSLFIK